MARIILPASERNALALISVFKNSDDDSQIKFVRRLLSILDDKGMQTNISLKNFFNARGVVSTELYLNKFKDGTHDFDLAFNTAKPIDVIDHIVWYMQYNYSGILSNLAKEYTQAMPTQSPEFA